MSTSSGSTDRPVKLFAFLTRKAGMSPAEFHEYWKRQHAPFFAETPEVRRHIRRYELHHRLAADEDRPRSDLEVPDAGFDGVAVQWFDSFAELQALRDEPLYQKFSPEDAPRYREADVAMVITGEPDVIVGPPGGAPGAGLGFLCILRRQAGWALPEFHDHWLHHHGGLFQTIPELKDPLLGYEQNHGLDLPDATYDGVTQQWFPSLKAWAVSLEVPAHSEIVAPDVASFLDPDSIHFVLADPPTVVIS
jgi:EthD domain